MSNVLSSNPIEIDSVLPSFKSAAAVTALGSLFTLIVRKVRWVNPKTAGDTLVINDLQGGRELLRLTAGAAGVDVVEDFAAGPKLWRDFQVVQIDSGRAFIHLI